MNTALFVIAVLLNGTLQIESTYPMTSLVACEEVLRHQAVVDSYPDRLLFCWDGNETLDVSWRKEKAARTPR